MSKSKLVDIIKLHPRGLWVISFTVAIIVFGFATMNSLLILYTTSFLHIPSGKAYLIFATYNSLIFTMPLAGGYIAEKLGYKRALTLGIFMNIIAPFILSVTHLYAMYIALGVSVIGTALYVPSYLVLQGKLYAKDDDRRESGFTISYLIMNMGFFVAGISGGYLSTDLGFHTTFIIAGCVVATSSILYFLGRKYITPFEGRSIDPQLTWNKLASWFALLAVTTLLVLASISLLENVRANNILLVILITAVTLLIIYAASKRKDKLARRKLYAFLILSYISVGFWALYTLEPSLLTLFIKNNVDRHIFSSIIPPSTFYSLDAFYILIFGSVFGYLWTRLAKINRNPTLPTKFTLSLFFMAIGFFVLIAGIYFADKNGLSHMFWIFICYAFLSIGELMIGPIGQSMVGKLSPEGMEGRLMGVWQLFTGFAGALSGLLAQYAVVPKHATTQVSNPIYMSAFAKIGLITFTLGIASLILIPFLKGLIKDESTTK